MHKGYTILIKFNITILIKYPARVQRAVKLRVSTIYTGYIGLSQSGKYENN